jgi:hypothetical protein
MINWPVTKKIAEEMEGEAASKSAQYCHSWHHMAKIKAAMRMST